MAEGNDILRFEDLRAWQLGRELSKRIYALTAGEQFSRDYGLRDQVQRAAVSVMTNVSEGFERGSNKDFVRFLFISRGSVGEVRSLLYVALDQGYIDDKVFKEITAICIESSRVTWGLIKSLRKKADWVTGVKTILAGLTFGHFSLSTTLTS
ncbi:hypothetical protein BVX94_01415 [bacterium B17]|nr:hypothetical protein BVX94_01415 [bacterium B17]